MQGVLPTTTPAQGQGAADEDEEDGDETAVEEGGEAEGEAASWA